jgi:hypothetical protein
LEFAIFIFQSSQRDKPTFRHDFRAGYWALVEDWRRCANGFSKRKALLTSAAAFDINRRSAKRMAGANETWPCIASQPGKNARGHPKFLRLYRFHIHFPFFR